MSVFDEAFAWPKHFRTRRPRDAQRSKVYAAERDCDTWSAKKEMEFPEAREYAQRCVEAYYIAYPNERPQRFMGRSLKVTSRGNRRVAASARNDEIFLPSWAWNTHVIIHEVSHSIAGQDAQHSWRFCQVFLRLYEIMRGKEDTDKLRLSFAKYGVRYTNPKEAAPPEFVAARAVSPRRITLKAVQRMIDANWFGHTLKWHKTCFGVYNVQNKFVGYVYVSGINDLTMDRWESSIRNVINGEAL